MAIVALGVPLALSLKARVNAEVRSQSQGQADLMAAVASDQLASANRAALAQLAQSVGTAASGRVIVVDAKGTVLVDTAKPPEIGASYAKRPEVAGALAGKRVQVQRSSRTLGREILATAVPIIRNGAPVGAVRITQSVAAVHQAIGRVELGLGLIGLIVLATGLWLGAVLAAQIARPLRRLERTARTVAGGDLSARAEIEGSREQRSLAESFNEMTGRILRLLGAQRAFVADASHQLRTPLTGLRLRLEEARATVLDDAVATQLDAGMTEVDRLAQIVEELLVLSCVGERELPGELLGTAELVDAACERWQALAIKREIVLEVGETDVASGSDEVLCARADAERALDALVENALRYSPAGSRVLIRSAGDRIQVGDRGPGIRDDEREAVFERFHRGAAGRAAPGSGLGLTIARELARSWGGEVTIANRQGGGAIACLVLARAGSRARESDRASRNRGEFASA